VTESYENAEERVIRTLKGRKALFRMVSDIAKNRRGLSILVISVITTAVAGTFIPLTIGEAVNSVNNRSITGVILFASIFLGLAMVQFASNRFRAISSTEVSQKTVKDMRDNAFKSIHKVPVSFFSIVKSGFLISRITNDGETIGDFLTFQIPQVVSGFTTVIMSIAIMLYLDFNLTLYALIVLPFLSLFTISLQGKVRANYLKTRKTIAAITGNLAENIGSVRSIKAFNVERYVEERFDGLNEENLRANIKASRLSSFYGAVVRVIEFLGIVIVIYAGALQLQSSLISIGILVAFIFYVQEFFDPVIQLSQLYNAYQSSIVGAGRIYGIIDSEKEEVPEGSRDKEDFTTDLSLKDVDFTYGMGDTLKEINMEIKRGDKIGIVGHTGAGKTTLSNLILKLYLPKDGEIDLDLVNTKLIMTKSYRDIIVPVLQEPFLFRGSIYENVRIAKKSATDEEIREKAKEFGLSRIFSRLPDGMETDVGELGRNLSEGQKQAIAILRALIREPDIIIMDEPTSNIDPFSERDIFMSLGKFAKNRTLILITHRFSMISLVDKIAVVDAGRIVENGTFEQLMEKKGLFYNMYNILYGKTDSDPL
jgi:ATP-binding cassette subfamily B protein